MISVTSFRNEQNKNVVEKIIKLKLQNTKKSLEMNMEETPEQNTSGNIQRKIT